MHALQNFAVSHLARKVDMASYTLLLRVGLEGFNVPAADHCEMIGLGGLRRDRDGIDQIANSLLVFHLPDIKKRGCFWARRVRLDLEVFRLHERGPIKGNDLLGRDSDSL